MTHSSPTRRSADLMPGRPMAEASDSLYPIKIRRAPRARSCTMRFLTSLVVAAALAPALSSADPIKVGIANDISGPFAALGAEARDGFNLAIKQLGGQLGGQPAEFMQADMGGNTDQARPLVTRYIPREKIDFLTGPIEIGRAHV